MLGLLSRLKFIFAKKPDSVDSLHSHNLKRAQDLIGAIDRGGIPLNPMIVNRIGRDLGITVSESDSMNLTIEKIRLLLNSIQK
jgi:hypothetical protein